MLRNFNLGYALVCVLVLGACGYTEPGISIDGLAPVWAENIEINRSNTVIDLRYSYVGNGEKAIKMSNAVLLSSGYTGCDTAQPGWHEFQSGVGSNAFVAQRYLRYYFRLQEPSIVSFVVYDRSSDLSVDIVMRELPSSELVLDMKKMLCVNI